MKYKMSAVYSSHDSVSSGRRKLSCEISSDIHDLDILHRDFKWLPNSTRIRPSEETIARKRLKLTEIEDRWRSFDDYILATVFMRPHEMRKQADNKMKFCVDNINDGERFCQLSDQQPIETRFVPNEFPYNLVEGHHWVMWYLVKSRPYDSGRISRDIEQALANHIRECQRLTPESESESELASRSASVSDYTGTVAANSSSMPDPEFDFAW
jgi:hypothetical protein